MLKFSSFVFHSFFGRFVTCLHSSLAKMQNVRRLGVFTDFGRVLVPKTLSLLRLDERLEKVMCFDP